VGPSGRRVSPGGQRARRLGWIDLAARGDYLNYFGIVFLALTTALCYARILPALIAARLRPYAILAGLEIVVLAAAIAGLAAGH
jgi:hypothetical protein